MVYAMDTNIELAQKIRIFKEKDKYEILLYE